MHLPNLNVFLSVAASANAFAPGSGSTTPAHVDWSKHKWIAPKSTDLRSPCPGMNTLANHGFLPRDGRGLTVASVVKASLDGFNVQSDVVILAAKAGLIATAAPDTFTLEDIKLHNTIEHDASLSREDFAIGDNLHFNETIFQTLLNSNPGVDYYNTTSAGEVQRLRLLDSEKRNAEKLMNTAKEFTIRTRESSLYLAVMGDVLRGVAPKKFVQIFFREERLPLEEGWTRSKVPIDDNNLNVIMNPIFDASQWEPKAGQCSSVVFTLKENTTITF